MNKLTLVAFTCAALAVTSCQTVRQTASTADIETHVVQYPTVADIDIKPQRITSTETWFWNPFDRTTTKQRKENLIYDMVVKNDADVLIEPQIRLVKSGLERTLTISGFPAKYKNFRKASEADLIAIKNANGRTTTGNPVLVGENTTQSKNVTPQTVTVKAPTEVKEKKVAPATKTPKKKVTKKKKK